MGERIEKLIATNEKKNELLGPNESERIIDKAVKEIFMNSSDQSLLKKFVANSNNYTALARVLLYLVNDQNADTKSRLIARDALEQITNTRNN